MAKHTNTVVWLAADLSVVEPQHHGLHKHKGNPKARITATVLAHMTHNVHTETWERARHTETECYIMHRSPAGPRPAWHSPTWPNIWTFKSIWKLFVTIAILCWQPEGTASTTGLASKKGVIFTTQRSKTRFTKTGVILWNSWSLPNRFGRRKCKCIFSFYCTCIVSVAKSPLSPSSLPVVTFPPSNLSHFLIVSFCTFFLFFTYFSRSPLLSCFCFSHSILLCHPFLYPSCSIIWMLLKQAFSILAATYFLTKNTAFLSWNSCHSKIKAPRRQLHVALN